MRLSRCSEKVTASIASLTSSSEPRSCSRARPADHRHGVEAAVEPGVGQQLTVGENGERRVDLPPKGDPGRRVAASGSRPAADVRSRRSMGALRAAAFLVGDRRIGERDFDAAQLGEQPGELGICRRPQRRRPRPPSAASPRSGSSSSRGRPIGDGHAAPRSPSGRCRGRRRGHASRSTRGRLGSTSPRPARG